MNQLIEFMTIMFSQKLPIVLWVSWLGIINIGALFFIAKYKEARYILAAMMLAFPIMFLTYTQLGYVRLLGIGHIVCWTPLLIWLWNRIEIIETGTKFEKYLRVLIASNGLSLVIDYVDFIRYFLKV